MSAELESALTEASQYGQAWHSERMLRVQKEIELSNCRAKVQKLEAVAEAARRMHPIIHEGRECQMVMGIPSYCDLARALAALDSEWP